MSASWDLCVPDDHTLALLALLSEPTPQPAAQSAPIHAPVRAPAVGLLAALDGTEQLCRAFVSELDVILSDVDQMAGAYSEVSSRTNALMGSCEALLEQQHALQELVHALTTSLAPFDLVEDFAPVLGIPVDAYGARIHASRSSSLTSSKPAHVVTLAQADPRSTDFLKTINYISLAMRAVRANPGMRDAALHRRWLAQLQHRALAITTRNMLELLGSTDAACRTQLAGQLSALTAANSHNLPLESLAMYTKFRALGFRMRQLSALLPSHASEEEEEEDGNTRGNASPEADVRQSYVSTRASLVLLLLDRMHAAGQGGAEGRGPSLCQSIRATLVCATRLAVLEQQLFFALFREDPLPSPTLPPADGSDASASATTASGMEYSGEVDAVLEAMCAACAAHLRPMVIREGSVDELCRVASGLAEDTRGQVALLRLPRALLRRFERLLDDIVGDAKERLAFCAELVLRQHVQMFEPLPSQLAYPQLLEHAQGGDADADITKTWYPPLTSALSLLSRLYGVVERGVFEDFARRTVDSLLVALRAGADGVRRRSALHGELFLIRHILLLREQLAPFETTLQTTERRLDFTPTGRMLTGLASRSVLRFDSTNGFVQLAINGLPSIHDTLLDSKKDIDALLKLSCLGLKQAAIKALLGPAEAFLAKVSAFNVQVGADVSDRRDRSADSGARGKEPVTGSAEAMAALRAQSFMKPDRIKETLGTALDAVLQGAPDVKAALELYVDNQVARSILMKPVLLEADGARKKLGFIVRAFVESPVQQRELEQLLSAIAAAATAGLTY